ncbi:MAG: hypothetical protein A2X53_05235 [Candidatus Rokubacteria bacterium GWA2_70_23]|nr:MAG: hypothetical protein A2X53_05235 [Candidatus Rokubacteria bacterium GWA2_70_23]
MVDTTRGTRNGANSVLGYYRKGGPPSMDLSMDLLMAAHEKIEFPPGYGVELHGDMTQMEESFQRLLRGLLLAVIFTFLLLLAQFRSLIEPFNEEDIYPRVTGRIMEMTVYPGDAVRAGQIVARLDDVELSSRVREAEAMLATSQAGRARMEADLSAARHGVTHMKRELAMVEAEVTYARALIARTERLFNTGAVSRQEYESDRAMAAAAEAKREAARATIEQARAIEVSARRKVEASESMVTQRQAGARTAQVVRDYVTPSWPRARATW